MTLLQISCTAAMLLASAAQVPAQVQPGTLLWSYSVPYTIGSAAAIAPDGTIYLPTSGALYAITNAGSNKWTFAVGVVKSPAIGVDGTVYFGAPNASFYAVAPNGSQKWAYDLQAGSETEVTYSSSPAIGVDGSIYFHACGWLYALDAGGHKKWRFLIDEGCPGSALSPVVGSDGSVYVGSFYARLFYALGRDGRLEWAVPVDFSCAESAAIGGDRTIYVSTYGLSAISPSGSILWSTPDGVRVGGSPVIGADGTIYAGHRDHTSLWSISPAGQTNWSAIAAPVFHPPDPTVPAIDRDGTIYYCNSNAVWALNPQGAPLWVYAVPYGSVPVPATIVSPTIGPDGTVYAAFDRTLYAIKGSLGPGRTPWPMYRQNPRHTGKEERAVLDAPQKRGDGGFQFQLYPAQFGVSYSVECSTDLDRWTSVTGFVATALPMPVVDSEASNAPARFYRASSP